MKVKNIDSFLFFPGLTILLGYITNTLASLNLIPNQVENIFVVITVIYLLIYIVLNLSIVKKEKFLIWITLYIALSFYASIRSLRTDQMIITTINTFSKVAYFGVIFLASFIYSKKHFYMIKKSFKILTDVVFVIFTLVVIANVFFTRTILINSIYYLLVLLPLLLLENTRISRIKLILIVLLVFATLKITAIFTSLVVLLVFALIITYNSRSSYQKNKNIQVLALSIVLFFSLYVILSLLPNDFTIARINISNILDSGGSGRTTIWSDTWKYQLKANNNQWLFGHGYDGVSRYIPWRISAHNDYLEILFDYGILALMSYLLFLLTVLSTIKRKAGNKVRVLASLSVSIVLILLMSFTSHLVIYQTYYGILVAFLGINLNWKNEVLCSE